METMTQIGDFAKNRIAQEWQASGHRLTGAFEESLQFEEKQVSGGIGFQITGLIYGAVLNVGVKPERVPFYPGSGRRTSKYITGLIGWVQKRLGIPADKAKGVAFAIAHTHKEVGIMSRNGQGIGGSGFLDKMKRDTDKEIESRLLNVLDEKINKTWQ